MAPIKRRNKWGKQSTLFPVRYHGNWCGPGWSAGKWQDSKCDLSVPAIDEFDATCKTHDCAYDLGYDKKKADYQFYHKNIGKGPKRSAAAIGVGAQGYLRSEHQEKSLSVKNN